MRNNTHYSPTEMGFSISGSNEIFNRTLYGSHAHDDKTERFFTFAGDAPQFMGAVCNWQKDPITYQEKRGVLRSGLAITPGRRAAFYYSNDIDQSSRWFHDSEDILAEFKNGWMEYELAQMSSWFPDVQIKIEVYPLLPDDGYLVHYHITTDQRVYFAAAFGGMTGMQGRFELKGEPRRNFTAADAAGNTLAIGKDRACITHSDSGSTMQIAASFPANFSLGSAKAMADLYPSTFLAADPEHDDDQVVRISAPILPGETLDGFLIAIYNADDATVDKWLSMTDPISYIKQQILAKFACIDVTTPDQHMDLTVPPTVIALDAAWHKDAFYHGAFAYHNPYLGWRNWYAPTALGWGDRVETTIDMWLSHLTKGDISQERVWYDDTPIPKGKSMFVSSHQLHSIANPVGRLPAYFNSDGSPRYGPYNMQECALDMMLYYIEWSGNMAFAEKHFDDMCSMIEWEQRTFDPNDTGLYQNVLNTWISDGHCYFGAGCAQSSAYNYRANLVLSKIAQMLGRDGSSFANRAKKIKKALFEKLWVPHKGIIAESLDTMGNCLLHTSVELPTIYHVIDSDMIDVLRAYCTLRYTEHHLKSIVTPGTDGRLCYSSNWLPKQYSNCGIFPNENAHLALAYFKVGLKEEGKKLLDGIADCCFTGKVPGMAPHIQSARCTSDFGDQDFCDVSSTYLRLLVEGLFGIRIDHLNNCVSIAPGFPSEWDHASLTLKDIDLLYTRKGAQEIFTICCDKAETKRIRIPMRATSVDAVLLDGEPAEYKIVPGPNCSFLFVETDKTSRFQLRVLHGSAPIPTVTCPKTALPGSRLAFEVKGGALKDVVDISETLADITIVDNNIYATAKDVEGDHTLFLRVVSGQYDTWLAADYEIITENAVEEPLEEKPFTPVDMSGIFNCNMTEVHTQEYVHPRPEGFSMSLHRNARHAHNWNQYGYRTAYVDDSLFRNSGGTVYSPSGIPFATPAEKENLACVSMFKNFPSDICVPLSGKAQEIAVLYVASTYPMQSHVENARITVTYADGTTTQTGLVYPFHVDDWLSSALTTEAEIFYFSQYNHGTVKKIRLDPTKELANIKIEALANEIILGVAGISISR